MIKPRYESIDKDNQPFTVTAEKATQDSVNPGLIHLVQPTADIGLKNGAWVAAKAQSGIYEQEAEKLTLNGNVTLFHDGGYQMESEELRLDLTAQTAFSDKDVFAQGAEGTLNAIGLDGDAASEILIFKGPAKLVLDTQELDLRNVTP